MKKNIIIGVVVLVLVAAALLFILRKPATKSTDSQPEPLLSR
jgi:uncharacterized protein YxeA